ncbi:riboflavin synthase domain-like protein [Nemania sp. NC0429]|nr:riboflavin synthase domain-like protein [Nemania sp. NC0429]
MASEQSSHHVGDVEDVDALDRRKILILYGSETGNSEESANDLERMARRLHFQTLLEEMDDVKLSDLLRYTLVIFVISTTGQGDLPKNARKFWKSLLRKRLPPDCLAQLKFTTFGLGDSSYFQYNWAARKLHKRLEQLGAVEFLPRGEADERHEDGIDGTFLPWCQTVRTYLEKECPLPQGLMPIPPDVQLAPKFTIELVEQNLVMGTSDERIPDTHVVMAESTSQAENISRPLPTAVPQTTASQKKTPTKYHRQRNIDNHGRELNGEAALSSHADTSPHSIQQLKYELEGEERVSTHRTLVHLSNGIAETWPRGADILDRPNILKDSAIRDPLEDHAKIQEGPPPSLLPIPDSWCGIVGENIRVTPKSHWQDVRQLVLRIGPRVGKNGIVENIRPEPGDVAVIYPKNFHRDVQALIDLMGWGDVADKPFRHSSLSSNLPGITPKNCYPLKNSTLRNLLTHNYDITCIPRRSFFAQIAGYTEDSTHGERLREFADPGRSDEFWDYTSRPRRSILEVLQDFPSVRVPYQHVPSLFPVMRGREYSIANGGVLLDDQEHPDDTMVELLVALVKYRTVLRKTREGLCSRYISSLTPGTPINIVLRRNKIPHIITQPSRPLIVVAPGTGVAPIRALLWDRKKTADEIKEQCAQVFLFYGGRNRKADFFFEDEWAALNVNVVHTFSRDQPHKIYVQDRLLQNYQTVCDFLRKGAAVCLCGSSGKMPEAVRLALYDCMVKGEMAIDREQAKAMFHDKFVYWEEVW